MKENRVEKKPVDFDSVFHLDGYETDDFSAVAIYGKNVGHAVVNKLFVLVQV